MLRNYIKIAWRNLQKNRTFSIINIAGLSFSVAFCLLLFFYIRYEQSYDSFHTKKDHLYRLEMTDAWARPEDAPKKNLFSFLTKGDDVKNELKFPLVVGTDMQAVFLEIKSITRFQELDGNYGAQLVKANNEVYKEGNAIYTDDNFFKTFSFHLKKGNAASVLSSPNNVVLSEKTAKKYFGNDDPIGKTIKLVSDSNKLFKVAGVAEEAPANSSIQYTLIMPAQASPRYKADIAERFNHSDYVFMIEFADGVSIPQFERKMNQWVKTYFADYRKDYKNLTADNFHWYLRPLPDCHYNASSNWGHYTNSKNIYQLACLVIIILLIASLNYVLIVISNSAARSQEIGIRKVMGANRRSVVLQFWVETQILVLIAVTIGFVLTRPLLPLFNKIIGTELGFNAVTWTKNIPAILLLCFLLGIVAGYYPALFLSRMKPATIIKSFSTFKINPRFSKILIVLQYTSCVILMICAFVINRQMQFIGNKDLGFDKDQVLIVNNPTMDAAFTKKVRDRFSVYAQSQSSISYFSTMNGGLAGEYNTNGFILDGKQTERKQVSVDYNYFEMLGLKFKQGRSFSKEFPTDSSMNPRSIVVNETLFKMLGKTAKLGEYNEPLDAKIIGVVTDYHFESLSNKIQPEEHVLGTKYAMRFLFKVKAGRMQPTITGIEKEWKTITSNYPFEYTFLDKTIAQMYEPELRWQNTIQVSCFFAIFIACLGLFGLSAINAVNRMKEIGIRKILGASVKDIVTTLSGDFILMVSISIVIATPIAWFVMNKWLEDFAYRINISWWMFVIVGLIALLIALLATGFQALKAAVANPVKSLRTE
jgi:putative ABC transport system permease protein